MYSDSWDRGQVEEIGHTLEICIWTAIASTLLDGF